MSETCKDKQEAQVDIVSEGPTVIPGKEEKNESKHNSDLF